MINSLFSETNLLKDNFDFKPGINIVLGKYSGGKKATGVNGIGKSTLIRLLSYLFLSDSAEKIFNSKKYNFLREEKHTITVEFSIKEEKYYIKRTFEKKDNILFRGLDGSFEEYTKSDLKKILLNKLFPFDTKDVFFEGERYGTLMHFFIKDDLESIQRDNPLKFLPYNANARETAIYNFYLLNLPTRNLIVFNKYASEYESYNETISNLESKIFEQTGKEVEEFRTEKIQLENKINLLEKSLYDYKFLETYKNIEEQLLLVTQKINKELKQYHSLNIKLKKVRTSLEEQENIDTGKIQKIYNDCLESFGDLVKKNLDDVLEFKNGIVENRKKFFLAREIQLQKEVDVVLKSISRMENERSLFYKRLDEKGALDGLSNTYYELVKEKNKLETNLQTLRQIDDIQEILSDKNVSISESKREIVKELKSNEKYVNHLREFFQEILKNAIFLGEDLSHAFFDVAISQNNARSRLPFKVDIEVPRAEALGQSRLKIVAYDLMVFLNSVTSDRGIPNFLMHDGVFHGISTKTIVNTLNYVNSFNLKVPNFQYFVTFNEDDIFFSEEKRNIYGDFDFDFDDMVIAEFQDKPEKMIFKRNFG